LYFRQWSKERYNFLILNDSLKSNTVDHHKIKCANCKTNETPLWRRDKRGHFICNACGLYYKLHGVSCPIQLKQSFIKRRPRANCQHLKNSNAQYTRKEYPLMKQQSKSNPVERMSSLEQFQAPFLSHNEDNLTSLARLASQYEPNCTSQLFQNSRKNPMSLSEILLNPSNL
jgi:ribosomal protein L37AE/L43A